MASWYEVEASVNGKRTYCGRLWTTERELRRHLGASIQIMRGGTNMNLVTVVKRPPKERS